MIRLAKSERRLRANYGFTSECQLGTFFRQSHFDRLQLHLVEIRGSTHQLLAHDLLGEFNAYLGRKVRASQNLHIILEHQDALWQLTLYASDNSMLATRKPTAARPNSLFLYNAIGESVSLTKQMRCWLLLRFANIRQLCSNIYNLLS